MANNVISDESLFEIQSDAINNLAQKESCIIVGRCSDYILRNMKECMNVFISADIEYRIPRIMKLDNLSAEAARKYIEQGDRKRARYYNYYTFKKWGDSSSYDLCIDSSRLGSIDKCVEAIKSYMKIYFDSGQ